MLNPKEKKKISKTYMLPFPFEDKAYFLKIITK